MSWGILQGEGEAGGQDETTLKHLRRPMAVDDVKQLSRPRNAHLGCSDAFEAVDVEMEGFTAAPQPSSLMTTRVGATTCPCSAEQQQYDDLGGEVDLI
jgi:hypothetical protein